MLVLNIGLNIGTETKLDARRVKDSLASMGFTRLCDGGPSLVIHASDTEPTAVVVVAGDMDVRRAQMVHDLAVDLEQEAIAVYDPHAKTGYVLGPKAEAWGAFNPAFFILSDGSRLGGSDV